MKDIGRKIKKVREFKDIKREYVANKLGIGISAYGNIERGGVSLSKERLAQIAEILGESEEFIEHFQEAPIFSNVSNTSGVVGFNNKSTVNDNQEVFLEMNKNLESIYHLLIKILDKNS